jgi:hypothetical protein
MPFIHWEMKSKQLDMDFFFLLRLLLRLLQDHKTGESADSLQCLSSEDMDFLQSSLDAHWESSPESGRESSVKSSKLVQIPLDISVENGNASKRAAVSILPKSWGLSSDDLEIFRARPPGSQELYITNSKRGMFKSPVGVLESLQRCYDFILDRDREKELVHWYVGDDHPLHIRRTLDQFYYYMLDNTRARNRDQVVSRYAANNQMLPKQQPVVMMVDQLWLWMIEGRENTMASIKDLLTYLNL